MPIHPDTAKANKKAKNSAPPRLDSAPHSAGASGRVVGSPSKQVKAQPHAQRSALYGKGFDATLYGVNQKPKRTRGHLGGSAAASPAHATAHAKLRPPTHMPTVQTYAHIRPIADALGVTASASSAASGSATSPLRVFGHMPQTDSPYV